MKLPKTPCQVLSLGCFGCCGRFYGSREEVLESIHIATDRWQQERKNVGKTLSLKEYTFSHKALRSSGVCPHVVQEKERFLCSVHPEIHDEEVREGYCNTEFFCKAAKHFIGMSDDEKKAYLAFLQQKIRKGMDSYDYSMKNDKDELITEFLHSQREK